MTWFHFCTANHNQTGRSSLSDMAEWYEAGLRDLGHRVTFSESHLESGAVNIFWECFSPKMVKAIREKNIPYGIIATEIPTGNTFNWRTEAKWAKRFECFKEVAQRSRFIWTMVEDSVPFSAQFSATAYVPFGFSERLIPSYINDTPRHDFCFFGNRTPYRESAINKIRKHADVEWPEAFLTPAQIGALIGASKIGINFKQSPQWPIPSPTRLGRLIMAKRGIACEYVPVPTRQGEIVGLCPPDMDFADYALSLLSGDYKARAEETFERYRTEMPMSQILEQVTDVTLANTNLTHDDGKIRICNENYPRLITPAVRSRLARVIGRAKKLIHSN